MLKRCGICKLLVLALGLLFFVESQVCAAPMNWPKPWDRDVKLRVGPDNPTNETHKYGTWTGGKAGMKYAVDLLPLSSDLREGKDIKIYAPAGGTIVCSSLDPESASCGKSDGHGGFGNHIRIKTADNEIYLIAHLKEFAQGKEFKRNATVQAGAYIGIMGNTGKPELYPVHLHFELTTRLMTEKIGLFGIEKEDFNSHSNETTALPGDMPITTLVVKGGYDNIEGILDELGWSYDLIDARAVTSADLTNIKQIYLNCGLSIRKKEDIEKIRSWVEAGGNLYASDLESTFVEPWGVKFGGTSLSGTIAAQIEDSGLKQYLGKSSVNINVSGSARSITNPYISKVMLRAGYAQGSGTNSPLAVSLNAGKGKVIYTTFHNHPGGTGIAPDMKKVVEYFAITPKKDAEVGKLLSKYGISSEFLIASSLSSLSDAKTSGIYVGNTTNGAKGTYLFKITDDFLNVKASKMAKSLTQSNNSCTVSLYKPNGILYKTVALDSDSVAIYVPAADNTEGAWQFKVNDYSGYSDSAMTIAASTSGEYTEEYTVTFNSQDGSAVPAVNVEAGKTVTKPADPTRSGYTFGGWYKESDCLTAWNFASDTVTSNITLYAKWTSNSGSNPGTTGASGSGGCDAGALGLLAGAAALCLLKGVSRKR